MNWTLRTRGRSAGGRWVLFRDGFGVQEWLGTMGVVVEVRRKAEVGRARKGR